MWIEYKKCEQLNLYVNTVLYHYQKWIITNTGTITQFSLSQNESYWLDSNLILGSWFLWILLYLIVILLYLLTMYGITLRYLTVSYNKVPLHKWIWENCSNESFCSVHFVQQIFSRQLQMQLCQQFLKGSILFFYTFLR